MSSLWLRNLSEFVVTTTLVTSQRLLRTLQETIECPRRDCWCHGLHTAFGSLLMFPCTDRKLSCPFLGHSHWAHPPSKARVCSRLDWQHLSNSYVSNWVFPFQTLLRNISSYLKFSSSAIWTIKKLLRNHTSTNMQPKSTPVSSCTGAWNLIQAEPAGPVAVWVCVRGHTHEALCLAFKFAPRSLRRETCSHHAVIMLLTTV